jgi:hypothetical protein
MTQELITEDQKAQLRILKSEFETEYIHFNDGDERTLQFNPGKGGYKTGISEKFGTKQATFEVRDILNAEVPHQLSMSSKRAIQSIIDHMMDGENVLKIKKTGSGNATKWDIRAA